MRFVFSLAAVLALGCSNRPSGSECEKTADKMLDVFASPRLGAGSSAPSELNQLSDGWRKVLKDKTGSPTRQYLIDQCRKKMTKSQAECIQQKSTADETSLAKCFSS
jgi:hypothetical protein